MKSYHPSLTKKHTTPILKPIISTANRGKNFGLSKDTFDQLTAQLKEGGQALFETVFCTHFEDCRSFLIKREYASAEEAYDAVMDTMIHFRLLIIQDKVKYGNLRFLFTLMARQKLLRQRNQLEREQSFLLDNALASQTDAPLIAEEDYQLLSQAFRKIGEGCQKLLREFYYHGCQLKTIAEREQRSPVAVRKQKSRCIALLRKYFKLLNQ